MPSSQSSESGNMTFQLRGGVYYRFSDVRTKHVWEMEKNYPTYYRTVEIKSTINIVTGMLSS